jgi:hypothetical protein
LKLKKNDINFSECVGDVRNRKKIWKSKKISEKKYEKSAVKIKENGQRKMENWRESDQNGLIGLFKNNGKSLFKWQNNVKKGAENSHLKMAYKDNQKMAGKVF